MSKIIEIKTRKIIDIGKSRQSRPFRAVVNLPPKTRVKSLLFQMYVKSYQTEF